MSADVFYEPQRVASVMDAAALGALIATTAPNIQYFTRYRKPGGAHDVVPEDLHRPLLLVPSSSLPFCLEDPCDAVEIKVYGSFIRYFADESSWMSTRHSCSGCIETRGQMPPGGTWWRKACGRRALTKPQWPSIQPRTARANSPPGCPALRCKAHQPSSANFA